MPREFRRLLAAEAVSNFGSMLSRVAIPWIATLLLAATPLEMGILVVADVLAGAVSSLFLGALVDRRDKRAVMLATDLARAALLALVAALAAIGVVAFWMLFVAAAATGLLTVAFELARSAWMAQRLAAGELPERNAQMSVATSLAETAAFALGGWLYQLLGAVLALAIDACSYVASALFVRGVGSAMPAQRQAAHRPGPASLLGEARSGLAVVGSTPTLRVLATIEVLVASGMSLAGTSYMIFVARDLGFDTGWLGMIFATGGIGSLLGAAAAPRVGRLLGHGRAMLLGLALATLGTACIPLAQGATLAGVILLVFHQVVGDGGHTLFNVYDRTLRQTATPAELLARADAGIRTLGQLARLAGALGGGALATAFGTWHALVLSATLFAAAALWLLAHLSRFAGPGAGPKA